MNVLEELIKEKTILQRKLSSIDRAIKELEVVYGEQKEETDIEQSTLLPSRLLDSKGKRGWKDYIVSILELKGGSLTTSDITSYIEENNPDIPTKTVKSAARQYLWQLKDSGEIIADKSEGRSKGYLYKLNDDPDLPQHR